MQFLFPFSKVPAGSSVIIYGMGEVGRGYLRQLWATKWCSVQFAVDENWKDIRYGNVEICPPEALRQTKDTLVIVAVSDFAFQREILLKLKEYGIKENHIVKDLACIDDAVDDIMLCERRAAFRQALRIKRVVGKGLVRVGGENDGGYVMLDDFVCPGIAYSFGISNDVAWDDAMARRGYDVFMYDHTISALPKPRDEFHFFKKGIAAEKDDVSGLDSLENFIEANGHLHEQRMILKMDTEGAEWSFLDAVGSDVLDQFDQLVFELHGFIGTDASYTCRMIEAMAKINKTHQAVHVHANNYCTPIWDNQRPWPYAFEVTYANRSQYVFEEYPDLRLPIALDAPCNPLASEIPLGLWNKD